MEAKTKTVYLGSLGLAVYFELNGTRYRTIDHAPSSTPSIGARQCLNMDTLKAESINCRERCHVEHKD